MQITNLNPDADIGASAWLVELDDHRILLDSGMHPKLAVSYTHLDVYKRQAQLGGLALEAVNLLDDFDGDEDVVVPEI